MSDNLPPTLYRIQIPNDKTYEELGPLSIDELILLAEKKILSTQSLYFDERENTWLPILNNSQLYTTLFKTPPQPVSTQTSPTTSSTTYEILLSNPEKPALKEAKPCTLETLISLYKAGTITPNTIVFDKDRNTWIPLKNAQTLYLAITASTKTNAPDSTPVTPPKALKPLNFRAPKDEPNHAHIAVPSSFKNEQLPNLADHHPTPPPTLKIKTTEITPPPTITPVPTQTHSPTIPLLKKPDTTPPPPPSTPLPTLSVKKNIPPQKTTSLSQYFHTFHSILSSLACFLFSALFYVQHHQEFTTFKQNLYQEGLSLLIQKPFIVFMLLCIFLGLHYSIPKLSSVSQLLKVLLGSLLAYAFSHFVLFAHTSSPVIFSTIISLLAGISCIHVSQKSWRIGTIIILLACGYLCQLYILENNYSALYFIIAITLGLYTSFHNYNKPKISSSILMASNILIVTFLIFFRIA